MAYARKGELGSDVYVWTDGRMIYCTDCTLLDGYERQEFATDDRKKMRVHLCAHETAGHEVPYAAIQRLEREMNPPPYERSIEGRMSTVLRPPKFDPGEALVRYQVVLAVAGVTVKLWSLEVDLLKADEFGLPDANREMGNWQVAEIQRLERFMRENPGIGPQTLRAKYRPENYERLDPKEQWAIDKKLKILDWDGSRTS